VDASRGVELAPVVLHTRFVRIEGVLGGVDYHQFYLLADDDAGFPVYPSGGPPNELVRTLASGAGACVKTGIAAGVISLAIEVRDAPPSELDSSQAWEAVAEVSVQARSSSGRIFLLMDSPDPPFDAFELPANSAWYRLRAHAVGRALDFDVAVSEPRETHFLQIWPTVAVEQSTEIRADDPWANQDS
jgi:hypothetical protein